MKLLSQYVILLTVLSSSSVLAIIYNGTANSWSRYSKWNLCPHRPASLYLTFKTSEDDGLLVYMDDGKTPNPTDYLMVQLVGGKVSLEYQFSKDMSGRGPATFTRTDVDIAQDTIVSISIERKRMALVLAIDTDPGTSPQIPNFGEDLCFGDCQGGLEYVLSTRNSDMFIGGVPQSIRDTRRAVNFPPAFKGEIYDVDYKNCECVRSNPVLVDVGTSIDKTEDPCFNKTVAGQVCTRLITPKATRCNCAPNIGDSTCTSDIEYSLDFDSQDNTYLVNNDGLDANVTGTIDFLAFPRRFLSVGPTAFAQLAGRSQRDECLGNLDLCPAGYTLSFWIVILNADLSLRNNQILLDNGGYNSHGLTVFWSNNALYTKFRKPGGLTWTNVAHELYPAQVYYGPGDNFVNYWYHFAATWSDTRGLQVYLNGEPVGAPSNPTMESVTDIRMPFIIGASPYNSNANKMGISELKFFAKWMNQEQIIGFYGPRHYFFSMNKVIPSASGNMVAAWPTSLQARLFGESQMVTGRSDMAMQLGWSTSSGIESYIDAGDVSKTCFGQVAKCDFYISFWIMVADVSSTMTVLDTGKFGISVLFRDSALVALIYAKTKPIALTFTNPQANQWYFVEIDRNLRTKYNSLWINGILVNQQQLPPFGSIPPQNLHQGVSNNLLIGRRNPGSDFTYPSTGMFTIDRLDLLQGSRDYLMKIGHIQRGVPPHIFYNMEKPQSGQNMYSVLFKNQSIQHLPTVEVMNPNQGFQYVPGKSMYALLLSGATAGMTQPRRNEECYNNLEKCVHGLLVRGWFNLQILVDNAGYMSSGFSGISMGYFNGRLVITANTLSKAWRLEITTAMERKWMFLEISFHPKFGLSVFKDKELIADTVAYSNVNYRPAVLPSKFILGGTNDINMNNGALLVDDLEIWYGDRGYVCSFRIDSICYTERTKHYVIDFDNWDYDYSGRLQHEELIIPAYGYLVDGLYDQALDVSGISHSPTTVSDIKPRTPARDHWLGNLAYVQGSGYTVSFYVKPEASMLSASNQAIYFLSTGVNGIDVYYKNNRLHAEARLGNRKWSVSSPVDYLKADEWNYIIVAWSPVKGLLLAKDERLYLVNQDMFGQQIANEVTTGSQFFIGGVNQGGGRFDNHRSLQVMFDEMHIWQMYLLPGPPDHHSFSFERNHISFNKVEHPEFDVMLYGGQIVEGEVGNATSLSGSGQYVDLGEHSKLWIDDLEQCDQGFTMSFRIKPRNVFYQPDQVVLSGSSYEITTLSRSRLQVKVMTKDQEWEVRSYSMPSNGWTLIDISWTEDDGLQFYVNDTLSVRDQAGQPRTSPYTPSKMLVGKAENLANRRYFNGEVDELHFYRTTYQDLKKKDIFATPRCNFHKLLVTMDGIQGNRVVHENKTDILVFGGPQIVNGISETAIQLAPSQSIEIGRRLTCQSRPNSCLNGFTLRFTMKPISLGLTSYLISSNPVEIIYGNDRKLYVNYRSVDGVWQSALSGLEMDKWYTLDLSWDDENGMTVYVNDVQRAWQQMSFTSYPDYNDNLSFYINRPSGTLQTSYTRSELVVDTFGIWDAKRELLKACGTLPNIPPEVKHDAIYPDSQKGYIRLFYIPTEYEVKYNMDEELTIRFQATDEDGLLWYNVDGDIRSYLYLQDGDLWFATQKGNQPANKRWITNGQNFHNSKKDHVLVMKSSNGNSLFFTLDGTDLVNVRTNYRVKFLTEDFNIGGHKNVSQATGQAVKNSFVGIIRDIKFNGSLYNQEFDLFNEMWKENFPDYVRTSCDMKFDPPIDAICDEGDAPVTFLENDTYIIEQSWSKKGKKPSLEVIFTTVEPRGLLLFTGTKTGRYFALEVFDRNLYMVADVGNGLVQQMIGSDVADNRPHMVKFTFNTAENMVNVIYNSEHRDELDFPFTALGSRFNTLFEGQIYIGGHPDFYSLPWNIYSRSGFVGCVSVFQINTLSSDLRKLYQDQNAKNIVSGCQPFTSFCDSNPCKHGAPCYNRKNRFECDCRGLPFVNRQNAVCGEAALIGNINGTSYFDLSLGRDIKSHVNDFSIRFKTMTAEGTMFMTYSPSHPEYIKVFFDNGKLTVAVNIDGREVQTSLAGQYSDYEWHTLYIQRRADDMKTWVDGNSPTQVDITSKDFYIYMKTIRLGADIPNPVPPYFFGHITNIGFPDTIEGYPITDPRELPMVRYPITFLTSGAFIRVPNQVEEMVSDFKIIVLIKTAQRDSLFLYQPGQNGQYLAGMIKDGNLQVRFNFGGGDKLIDTNAFVSDRTWHILEIYRKDPKKLSTKVDSSPAFEAVISTESVSFNHLGPMFIGGIPRNVLLVPGLRQFYTQEMQGYRGCMASLVKSSTLIDIGNEGLQDLEVRNAKLIVRGCQNQQVCSQCLHGCTRSPWLTSCDNTMIPFQGRCCEDPGIGFHFNVSGSAGYIKYRYIPPVSSTYDRISFGFRTCSPNGLLGKISGANTQEQIKLYLESGNVVAKYQLGGPNVATLTTEKTYSDSQLYILQFERNGLLGELTIRNSDTGAILEELDTFLSSTDEKLDGAQLLEIGSEEVDGVYTNVYNGVIHGFQHTNLAIFNLAKGLAAGTSIKEPGTSHIRGGNMTALTGMDLCLPPPPDAIDDCGPEKQTCQNFGVCENNRCNCTLTAYKGKFCTVQPTGHYYGFNNFEPGLAIHEYPEAVTTDEDYFAVGIMTYEPNGTIFRVESSDGTQYYHLRLINGHAQLEYRLRNRQMFITEDRMTLHSELSKYYVIRMNRTGDNVTFYVHNLQRYKVDDNIRGIPFRNQKELTSGGIMQQGQIKKDWNGILGGLYYNGKFIYLMSFSDATYRKFGDIEIVYDPYQLKFPPVVCPVCVNGIRTEDGLCNCEYTGFAGKCCDESPLFGFQFKRYGSDAVLVYKNESMDGRDIDELSVSFKTAKGWGNAEILRVESLNGEQYIVVEIVDNLLKVRHNIGGIESEEVFRTVDIRQQRHHHVRIYRKGQTGYIELKTGDTQLEVIKKENVLFEDADIFNAKVIYVGGRFINDTYVRAGHYGIIWNVNFNGLDLVEVTRLKGADAGVFVVNEAGKDFEIIPSPWPILCDKETHSTCMPESPVPPVFGGAGGSFPEPNVVASPAGVVYPPVTGGPITVPVIAAIMGGLIFTSAIVFAAAGMKPGFLALSKGMVGGAGGKGAYIPVADSKLGTFPNSHSNYMGTIGMETDGGGGGGGASQAGTRSLYEESVNQETRFDATDASLMGGATMNGGGGVGGGGFNTYNSTNTWYARNETIENQGGYGGSTMGGYRNGYAGSVAGGSVAGSVYGFGTVTNPDQAFITLSEDIAVDNVVLTADGRYVVTGSNLGPPQVWNTNNGEMVTTMRGDFMGSTGLHLAANEQYLVGETMAEQASVDMNDIQTGNHIPIRRVAVWDFNTGNPLPIAVDQLCTASCVSKDGFKVVMAMTDKFGGGTTVKVLDLLSNKVIHEITYPETIGVADSASCVFISPDDRFVAVGFTNSFDNNANFIVFDLFNKSGVVDSPIVALNADPHCTVILNHDEALTGTRNGELVIWSMKTGKAQRQLTSGDTTMLSQRGMPAAHDMEVKEVALSDDGRYLASASADRTVKIWNMSSESLMHTLHGHNDEVWTVDIASDNTIVVSGSQDGTIKLWRLRNGNQITSFNATMDIFHARFSKDKKTVVALGDKFGARKLIMLQIVSQKKWRMKSTS